MPGIFCAKKKVKTNVKEWFSDGLGGGDGLRAKLDESSYEEGSIWKELADLCGEQKNNDYFVFYVLSEEKEQSSAAREEYKNYLLDQGYEFQSTDDVYGDIYIKKNYAVLVPELSEPMRWKEYPDGQYTLCLYFY